MLNQPTSSPMMKRMLGFFSWAAAGMAVSASTLTDASTKRKILPMNFTFPSCKGFSVSEDVSNGHAALWDCPTTSFPAARFNRIENRLPVEGLPKISHSPKPQGLLCHPGAVVAGYDDDGNWGVRSGQDLLQRKAAHSRQLNIEDEAAGVFHQPGLNKRFGRAKAGTPISG